jgi:CRISPR-associated protein Csy2
MNLKDLEPDGILVLPHMHVQNANAISSSLTHGFPSMTAFLGFMWALGRQLAVAGIPLRPEKIGVVCHWYQEQVSEGYVRTFHLTRNPVDKHGSTAAIVEEGRVHLEITVVLQVGAVGSGGEPNVLFQGDPASRQALAWTIRDLVGSMRIAGGTVLPPESDLGTLSIPALIAWPGSDEERLRLFRRLRRRWLPGFALVSRDDLLQRNLERMRGANPAATLLDAWLDLSRFNYSSRRDENGEVVWEHDRPENAGWIVPIPVGYGALADLQEGGVVADARDNHTPFRFVESVYSIGQWIGPHRLQRLQDFLWWGEYSEQGGLYRCCNHYVAAPIEEDFSEFSDPGGVGLELS